MAADIFTDICRFPEELDVGLPQRLQTSMSLYSNNLSGLVLLTDDACMSLENSKMTNEFDGKIALWNRILHEFTRK